MDVSGYSRFLIDVCGYFRSLVDVCGYFKSLADIIGYLILVDFSKFFRLVNLSGFPRFWFRVKVVYYKIFLFTI